MIFSLTLPVGSLSLRASFSAFFFLFLAGAAYSDTEIVATLLDDIAQHTTPSWRDVTEASISPIQVAPMRSGGQPKWWIGTYLDSQGTVFSSWRDSNTDSYGNSGYEETGAFGFWLTGDVAYIQEDSYGKSFSIVSGATTNVHDANLYALYYVPVGYVGTMEYFLGPDVYRYDVLRGTNGSPERSYTLARVIDVFYENYLSGLYGDDFLLSYSLPLESSVQFFTASSYESYPDPILPYSEAYYLSLNFSPEDHQELDTYFQGLFESAASFQGWSLGWAGVGVDVSSNGNLRPYSAPGFRWFQQIGDGSFLHSTSNGPYILAESNQYGMVAGGYAPSTVSTQSFSLPFLGVSTSSAFRVQSSAGSEFTSYGPGSLVDYGGYLDGPVFFRSDTRGPAYFANDSTNVVGSVELLPDLSMFDVYEFAPVGVHAFCVVHANTMGVGVYRYSIDDAYFVGIEQSDALNAYVILKRPDAGSVTRNVSMGVTNRIVISFSAPTSSPPPFVHSAAPASLPFLVRRSIVTNDLTIDGVPSFLR